MFLKVLRYNINNNNINNNNINNNNINNNNINNKTVIYMCVSADVGSEVDRPGDQVHPISRSAAEADV